MSFMIVSRHTRAEEETGRTELIRAGAVGAKAPVAAALLVVAGADVAIAAIAALGLIALGLPAAGSVALGASLGACGLMFAGVGAVTAQVTTSARAANGLAGVVLGAAFALRAVGDVQGNALTWLSPIGIAHEMRPFAGERWWPLLLCVLIAGACAALAFALLARRDVGAGLLPDRPGRPAATPHLRTALALAFRLQRGGLLAWSVGMFVVGLVLGLDQPQRAGPDRHEQERRRRDRAQRERGHRRCLLRQRPAARRADGDRLHDLGPLCGCARRRPPGTARCCCPRRCRACAGSAAIC